MGGFKEALMKQTLSELSLKGLDVNEMGDGLLETWGTDKISDVNA